MRKSFWRPGTQKPQEGSQASSEAAAAPAQAASSTHDEPAKSAGKKVSSKLAAMKFMVSATRETERKVETAQAEARASAAAWSFEVPTVPRPTAAAPASTQHTSSLGLEPPPRSVICIPDNSSTLGGTGSSSTAWAAAASARRSFKSFNDTVSSRHNSAQYVLEGGDTEEALRREAGAPDEADGVDDDEMMTSYLSMRGGAGKPGSGGPSSGKKRRVDGDGVRGDKTPKDQKKRSKSRGKKRSRE